MRLAKSLLHKSNKNAASDLAVGAMQAFAGRAEIGRASCRERV